MVSFHGKLRLHRFRRLWYAKLLRVCQNSRFLINSFPSIQESDVNAFTNTPHSTQYKKILETRKKLPVYAQMEEFYKAVSPTHPSRRGMPENRCQRAFVNALRQIGACIVPLCRTGALCMPCTPSSTLSISPGFPRLHFYCMTRF